MSQGERKILKILTKHNINNDPQYKFKDCKNIYPLRFDFGILNNSEKLLGLVEYHGEQHYIPTDFTKKLTLFEMEEELKERQARDQIKRPIVKRTTFLFFVYHILKSFQKVCLYIS